MKITRNIIIAIWSYLIFSSCVNQNIVSETINFQPDTITTFKNPCMGWMIYSEGWELYPYFYENYDRVNVKSFWDEMDAIKADQISNILYIRAVWSAFELEEGKFAWDHDQNFIDLVEGAKKRNLKLAFRVFHDSRDMEQQATPEYVFKAGASYEMVSSSGMEFKNPYYDDEVFMEKFKAFVKAFGERFDNPEEVDFIDAFGAGRWGEGHSLLLKDQKNHAWVIDQITSFYNQSFNHIIPVYNLSHADFSLAKDSVYEKRQFLARRDGLGSHWFTQEEKDLVDNYFFPKYPLIGEGCYWLNDPTGEVQTNWYEKDEDYKFNSWPEAISFGIDDALKHHSNTFDLRVPLQAKMWIEECSEVVQKFITHGGYRLYPSEISVAQLGNKLVVKHSWNNFGVGKLPNNHPNWNHKYGLSFALMNHKNELCYSKRMDEVNPADWIKGSTKSYTSEISLPASLESGEYKLVVGLTDRAKNNQAAIEIAVDEKFKINKWVKILPIRR